jgi:TetR/AcrR family tetracycline transcriptional repressor
VARPKEPLISKRAVLEIALRIIDEEGINALSIRRLASELNVNGASFYYHFHNKDEIIAGAAELALDDVRAPRDTGEDWREWLLRNTRLYRKALLNHPDLTMVMLRRGRMRIGLRRLDASVKRLEQQGVPMEVTWALVEALETFAIGSALAEANNGQRPEIPPEYPNLAQAVEGRGTTFEETFDIACRAIIDGVLASHGVESRSLPAARPTRRGTPGSRPR